MEWPKWPNQTHGKLETKRGCNSCSAPKRIDLPSEYSISKIDQKIIISPKTPAPEKGSKDL